MDSLLASYASSSDEENEEKSKSDLVTNTVSRPSLSSSLPQPQSLFSNPNPDVKEPTNGSIFSSLPADESNNSTNQLDFDSKPNQSTKRSSNFDREDDSYEEIEGQTSKVPLFSSLCAPKSNKSALLDLDSIFDETNKSEKKPLKGFISASLPAPKSKESTNPLGLDLNPRKVVRFTLPINPNLHNYKDEDDEEEEREKKKPIIIDPSFNSSSKFSSMLPAPKNSLCLAPQSNSSVFSSRKSSLNTQLPPISTPPIQDPITQYESYQTYDNPVPVQSNYETNPIYTETVSLETSSSYNNVESYAGIEGHNYNNNDESSNYDNTNLMINDLGRAKKGKRGRNEMPVEIMEVKQDELMKNRPKQDPNKLTGLAFGPSYPTAPSEKGKPSKLHKRKHQIGTLYHDMKSKEMELNERRSKGFLTKAETQAKYGW